MSKSRNISRSAPWYRDYQDSKLQRDFLSAAVALHGHVVSIERKEHPFTFNHAHKVLKLLGGLSGQITMAVNRDANFQQRTMATAMPTKDTYIQAAILCSGAFHLTKEIFVHRFGDRPEDGYSHCFGSCEETLAKLSRAIVYPAVSRG